VTYLLSLAVLPSLALGGYGGYRYALYSAPVIPPSQPHVITTTRTITRTVPVTVVGPTTIIKETCSETETIVTTDTKSTATVTSKHIPRNWSLGLVWHPTALVTDHNYMPAGIELGRHLAWDLWATATVDWQTKSLLLGVRYEW